MRIQTVEYRRLLSTGNFSNVTVGATAAVEDGDAADDVLRGLRSWVEGKLADEAGIDPERAREEVQRLHEYVRRARAELADVNQDLAVARAKWEQVAAFLEKHGVSAARFDDLPFD